MIESYSDLKFYLFHDRLRNVGDIPYWKYILKFAYGTDGVRAYRLLKSLRYYEYSINCLKNKSLYGKIIWGIRKWHYHIMCTKYDIVIKPNAVGYGIYLPHIVGGGIILNCKSMGNYCVVNVGCLCGCKKADEIPCIGNYVELATGCKVIGNVTIGDNSIVAPNSVVVKDVPPYSVVSGIPATILKTRNA